MLTDVFIEKLACPVCKGNLAPAGESNDKYSLLCVPCGLLYPVRDGIPVMLADEALKRVGQEPGVKDC
ncbi:MAG: Trm112 family protein [Steroidobacteraceae bacterium]|nr:Trm112 family protein [Deltaproteobacteria bacterium]